MFNLVARLVITQHGSFLASHFLLSTQRGRWLARTKSARYVKDAPTRAIFLWGGRSGGVRDLCRSMF